MRILFTICVILCIFQLKASDVYSKMNEPKYVEHIQSKYIPNQNAMMAKQGLRINNLNQQSRFLQKGWKDVGNAFKSAGKVALQAGVSTLVKSVLPPIKPVVPTVTQPTGGIAPPKPVMGLGGPPKGPRGPEDVEDCVACRMVWMQVEMDIGNSQVEQDIFDSFSSNCMEAQKAPIFYPACRAMMADIYGMIGDYLDGYTVDAQCEAARMCR